MLKRYNNAVEFKGEPLHVLEVLGWFKELIYEKGAHLDMGDEEFSNISFLGDGRVFFDCSGESGTDILREIAEEFDVSFVHYFGNSNTYGDAVYGQGNFEITVLDEDDLGLIAYDEAQMAYLLGEVPFSGQREAIDHFLAQKKAYKEQHKEGEKGFKSLKR